MHENSRRPKFIKTVWGWGIPLNKDASRRLILRAWGGYLLALTAWVTAVIVLAFTSLWFFSSLNWSPSPIYNLFIWIRDYFPLVGLRRCWWAGWSSAISIWRVPTGSCRPCWAQPNSWRIPRSSPLPCPLAMSEAEACFNLIRTQALRDAQNAKEAEQRKTTWWSIWRTISKRPSPASWAI